MARSQPETHVLPAAADTRAPDGSEIRRLVRGTRGSLVHVSLPAGWVSRAIAHPTVEELWLFLSGEGDLWRSSGDEAWVTPVRAGVAVSLPAGTAFQFRSTGPAPLTAVCTTMPPWPGDDEATPADGPWPARVDAG